MHLREVGTVGGQRSGSLTRGSPRSTGRPTGTERGSQVQPKREGPSGLCCGEGLRDKGGSKLGFKPQGPTHFLSAFVTLQIRAEDQETREWKYWLLESALLHIRLTAVSTEQF